MKPIGAIMDRPQRDFQPSYAQHSLATPLNFSQTIEGCTLTLKRAYADSHGIEIVASLSTDPDNEFTGYLPQLNDDAGTNFGVGGYSIGNGDVRLSFKVPETSFLPATLNLHLEVSAFRGHDFSYSKNVSPPSQYPTTPFKFDFRIPFYPARIVEVNQIADTDGTTVTLERISLVPSGVRFYLRFPRPANDTPYVVMLAWLRLQTPDARSLFSYRGMAHSLHSKGEATGDFSDNNFDEVPLYKQSGEWALTVSSMQYRDASQRSPTMFGAAPEPRNGVVGAWGHWVTAGEQPPTFPGFTTVPGEWVFNFTVPPPEE